MSPDKLGNGLHYPGEPGEVLSRDLGLCGHAEVSGGHNPGSVRGVIGDLQAHRFALELTRPGFRLVPGGLLGREGGREQQQQQGENSEHSSLSVQREKETRESQQIPLIGGRRVGISLYMATRPPLGCRPPSGEVAESGLRHTIRNRA